MKNSDKNNHKQQQDGIGLVLSVLPVIGMIIALALFIWLRRSPQPPITPTITPNSPTPIVITVIVTREITSLPSIVVSETSTLTPDPYAPLQYITTTPFETLPNPTSPIPTQQP